MKILIIAYHYQPDLGPSAPLFTMLCENLVKLGHQVTILTTVPHYPSGRVPPEFRGRGRLWRRSVENGVNVVRVTLPSVDRSKLSQRMLQFLCFQISATLAGLGQRFDAALVATPALAVWLPMAVLAVLPHIPAIYSVHDVYPGVGVTLGVFRNKGVIGLVSWLERFCLKRARIVRILSESFRSDLLQMGVPEAKMALVYDWVDTDLIRPLPRKNNFSKEHRLDEKCVVMYAGNIGLSQGLEHVLTAAELLKDEVDIYFLLVGDGQNREHLMAEAERRGLENVGFVPFQPRERLPEVLATADIALVSLQKGIGASSLPSKTYSILASGRPVIASIDENCEGWNLIEQAGAGVCVPPEDPTAIAETVIKLKENKELRRKMGERGRAWAERNHSPHSAARKIEHILAGIAA